MKVSTKKGYKLDIMNTFMKSNTSIEKLRRLCTLVGYLYGSYDVFTAGC